MPRLTSLQVLWAGIALVIAACLASIAIDIYQSAKIAPEIAQDRALVTHTFDVITTARALDAALQDAERGQRGFLITGDSTYLTPYRTGIRAVPALLSQLKQLTLVNPEQQGRMPMLQAQIDSRLALLEEAIDIRQSKGFAAAQHDVQSNQGRDSMRAVTALIGEIIASENRLLTERLGRAGADDRNVGIIAVTSTALTLAILVLGFALMAIALRERARQQTALDQARAVLAQAQKMETLGQLSGGIAHDFNNMLAVIKGGIGMLRRRLPTADPDLIRCIEGIDSGADRAASLTQRLLAFSRRQPLTPKPIDPNRLVAGMSDLLHRALGGSIEIETILAAVVPWISADSSQLENAILNLAVNARDAMPDGGKLTIETGNILFDEASAAKEQMTPGRYVMIAVSDTGTGMPPEVMSRAFEPFFTTKPEGQGTGLGLSQVYGFVKQSAGHIRIDSRIGKGTTVRLYLPPISTP
jgi:signal transduction histidine kinase